MNQCQTPLFDALVDFHKKEKVSFHVPGHKNGQVLMERGRSLYETLLSIDATELTGLDDLHAPDGPIMEAELLLADLYKVQRSYLLVNGSTSGNMAMVLATCRDGDTVLVQRNCHKSILNGLLLAHAKPIFLAPEFNHDWGVAGGVDVKLVSEALEQYPETKAIILTYPNYYGLTNPLESIIELAHQKEVPVLVDEAHGAHFTLGSPFPVSAVDIGADIVVHSAHKTLPAMTMGSYLHLNSSLLDEDRVSFFLQILQSSSPSYPIMGSLDLARAYLASFTENDLESLIKKISDFKNQLSSISEIKVLEPSTGMEMDPLKVSIQSACGLSGFELQTLLEEKGIYSELADPRNVLFVLPLLKQGETYSFNIIVDKIRDAVKDKKGEETHFSSLYWEEHQRITSLPLAYSKLEKAKRKKVLIRDAIGKISGEMVTPYPPGIPLIMFGELITEEHVATLERLLALHSHFHGGTGLADGRLIIYEAV